MGALSLPLLRAAITWTLRDGISVSAASTLDTDFLLVKAADLAFSPLIAVLFLAFRMGYSLQLHLGGGRRVIERKFSSPRALS